MAAGGMHSISAKQGLDSGFARTSGADEKIALRSQWTAIDGFRLHSRLANDKNGTPIVLIHGLVISSSYFVPLAECLARRHTVHALDLPGFGRSEAPVQVPDIPALARITIRWARNAGIERCHLVANSLGCQIAVQIGIEAPKLVESATLIGATVDPTARGKTRQVLRLAFDAIHEPPSLWIKWVRDFSHAGLRRSFATAGHMFHDHIEALLPKFRIPTLVIRGEHDPTMPMPWAEEAVRLLPEGRLAVVRGAYHCAHYTHPETVAELIEKHIGVTSMATFP